MTIQAEIIAMSQTFITVMEGEVYKDWTVDSGIVEFTPVQDPAVYVGMTFAPYSQIHSERKTSKTYKDLIELYLTEILNSDDEELKEWTDKLNSTVRENLNLDILEEIEEGYLRGAYDYQYSMWLKQINNSALSGFAERPYVMVKAKYKESEYFIYEDLALIRAGLDDRISNSPDYGKRLNNKIISDDKLDDLDIDLDDEVWDYVKDDEEPF